MQFHFDNVGPISSATIKLGALTVVCGKNNTGKTYLTNCLYEFYKMVTKRCSVKINEEISSDTEFVKIDLENYRKDVICAIQNCVKIFNQNSASLYGGNFNVDILENEIPLDFSASDSTWELESLTFKVKKFGTILEIKRCETIEDKNIQSKSDCKKTWYKIINVVVNAYLFKQKYNGGFISDAFSMMSERMGVTYFKDCIDIALRIYGQETDLGGFTVKEKSDDLLVFPENIYVLLNMISYISQHNKVGFYKKRKYLKNCLPNLENIIGGSYDIKNSKITFNPTGLNELNIAIQDSSSSVRALWTLDMYVRYFAEKGDLLVIDEPEMNLHPEKQRQLARFLAMLVNQGIKVFITTHSDYILREFNTLIKLSGDKPYLKQICKNEGYDKKELLKARDVRVYVSKDVGNKFEFEEVSVSEEDGLEIKSIDEVINEMNRIQDLIDWGN